jgi:predicted nucleic acid-binding protein
MPVKVVDASALSALLFGEPDAAGVAARLSGSELAAPALLGFEVANVCLKKMRVEPHRRDMLLAAFALFAEMIITIVEVDHAAVLETAERLGLTSYDAAYLFLAQRLGAELVTLDRRLAAAASRALGTA